VPAGLLISQYKYRYR